MLAQSKYKIAFRFCAIFEEISTMNIAHTLKIFEESISQYHILERVNQPFENPYEPKSLLF